MGITIHYHAKNELAKSHARDILSGKWRNADPDEQAKEEEQARKDAKLIVPKIASTRSRARNRFFRAIDHVEKRARELGWKFVGIDLTPKDATEYRDKDGRQLSWRDYGGGVIQYFWLPDPGSECVELGLNVDTGEFVGGFTKTQYIRTDRLKKHVEICEVLSEVNTILGGILEIHDEADYLPDRNIDAAGESFGESDALIAAVGNAIRAAGWSDTQIVTGEQLASDAAEDRDAA
jgi:hypothetical protein